MAKIDTSLWNNVRRLRERIRNLATMVLTSSIIGIYSAITTKNWFIVGILGLYFLTTLPIFISYARWQKNPPGEIVNE